MIADSSVLIYYARIHRLDLLCAATGPVLVTAEVRRECVTNAPGRPGALAIADALEAGILLPVQVEAGRVAELRQRHRRLHAGEASVIAAAIERGEPSVLLDDLPARSVARLLGLRPLGCLGVLLRARLVGVPLAAEDAEAVLRDLVANGYHVSAAVTEEFRRLLAEPPSPTNGKPAQSLGRAPR